MNIKKLFFKKPSKYDQITFNEIQELRKEVSNLDEHFVTLARVALVKPDRLYKESLNVKANAEYLVSLVKAKEEK